MKNYADQLIMEGRNNINHNGEYTRRMKCPNRKPLYPINEWASTKLYYEKANQKIPVCPSGENGLVEMRVRENGMWTTISCPRCNYAESWAAGDGDELF